MARHEGSRRSLPLMTHSFSLGLVDDLGDRFVGDDDATDEEDLFHITVAQREAGVPRYKDAFEDLGMLGRATSTNAVFLLALACHLGYSMFI